MGDQELVFGRGPWRDSDKAEGAAQSKRSPNREYNRQSQAWCQGDGVAIACIFANACVIGSEVDETAFGNPASPTAGCSTPALKTEPAPSNCTTGRSRSLLPPPTPNSTPNEFRTFYHTSVELMVRTAIGSTLTVTASSGDWLGSRSVVAGSHRM